MTTQIWICLGIFLFMILGYVFTDKLRTTSGVVATCVFCLVAFSGLLAPKDVLAVMSNANIPLIVCMFVVAAGFNRTQAVHKLSGLVYKVSGGNFKTALCGYLVLTFVLTQFIPSPMAVFAIIAPMAAAMCDECGVRPSKAMFPIALVVVSTCVVTPIGSGAVTFATQNGYLESYGYTDYEMQLLDPFKGRILASLFIIAYAMFIAPKFCPDQPSVPITMGASKKSEGKQAPQLSPVREFLGYFIFIATTVALIFQKQLGFASWQIALAGATLTVACGVLNPQEAVKAVPIRIVMLILAALSLGSAMVACGLGDLIGGAIANMLGGTKNGYVIGAVFFVIPFILTQFMQNQSVSNIFIPVLILTCKSLGCNPIGPLVLLQAATLTAFMTPMATPAIPVVMEYGGYNVKDLLKMGWLPSILIAVISVVSVMTIFPAY